MNHKIHKITDADMDWSWDSNELKYHTKLTYSNFGSHQKFDPFPCYGHDAQAVSKYAEDLENKFPIGHCVEYFLYYYEPLSRTNGSETIHTIYDNSATENKWDGEISLYGKRIPIHPAMTKYLCYHEYGHIVDDWICHKLGKGRDGLDKEYSAMRGIEYNGSYGGRKWHTNIGEIIANDFRICVGKAEEDFWPHDCIHPHSSETVQNWWAEAVEKYSILNKNGN